MLNFALVGCGRIAKRHADLLGDGKIAGARLGAVSDLKNERASEFGNKYGVPFFSDMNEMMEQVRPDVVVILTDSGSHARNTIELAGHGAHIIVEKPMALRMEDARQMIATCKENNVRLFVVKQNRFNLPVLAARKALEGGRFGDLVLGTVRVRWARDQKYYDRDAWRGKWASDGGVISNQASHHVDLLQWMFGDVVSVFAKKRTALANIEAEDVAVAILKFANGALGIIEATTATRPKDLEGSLSILGSEGSVEIGGFAVNEIKHWAFSKADEMDETARNSYSVNPPDVYGFGHQKYYEHVVAALADDELPAIDGETGFKSLELIHAIYESAESDTEVFLPFEPRSSRLGKRT